MKKITMLTDCILLSKLAEKPREFEITGDADPNSPVYEVRFCGPDAGVEPTDLVILKPGSYENQIIDGVTYLYAEGSQVAGKVKL